MATALSVTVMIMAMAIVTGFKDTISQKLYGFMGHVHVVPFDETRSNALTFSEPVALDSKLISSIKQLPHVAAVYPFMEKPCIVQANGAIEGVILKGVNKDYRFLSGITLTGNNIDFSDSAYAKQVLLSKTTADIINANVGDTVRINFLEGGIPRVRKVRLAGIFHSGLNDVDKLFGVCDMRLLQRINGWSADSINGYQVDLDNIAYADTVSNYIHYNLTQPPLESYTTAETYDFIFDWLNLQNLNSTILLVIMAIVGIINMGSVLVILIVDRAKMIGLLTALGMAFDDMRKIFLGIAGLIGAVGILLGNVLALALCWLQARYGFVKLPEKEYYMSTVPIKVIWWQIAVIDVVTLLLCVFCMWLPALYIRRIQPARVLQFK